MMRRAYSTLAVLLMVTALAAPAIAQTEQYVNVQSASFEWTGKTGREANFSWSATVANPTKRPNVELRVTLILVDSAGNTIGTDTVDVMVGKEASAEVSNSGSLAYDDAAQVAQYRVSVASGDA